MLFLFSSVIDYYTVMIVFWGGSQFISGSHPDRKEAEKKLLEQKSEQVPWSTQQAFTGVVATLVPWVIIALGLSSLNTRSSVTRPLSTAQDLISAIITFFIASLIEGAFLIAPFIYATRAFRGFADRGRQALQALGFRGFSVVRALAWVIGLFIAILLLNVLYQNVITTFHLNLQTNDQVILREGKVAPLTTYATLIASVLVAPICEEIFFRGFVFAGLLRSMPVALAVVMSALIFAVAHADPGSFLVLFFIGMGLAFLRWYTNSLWPGILLHLLNNGIGALLIVLAMKGFITP
jgi:membrane protease YdiL (CAAX protease family)